MKSLKDQRGVSHILLLAALAVIVIVGVVGYRVVNNTDTGTGPNVSISSSTTSQPSAIKSQADLKKAAQALDNTAIDGSLNPGQLDADINALN